MIRKMGLIFLALLVAMPAFAAQRRAPVPPPTPERTVAGFYGAYVKMQPGGIPAARDRLRLRPYLSEKLYALIQDGDRAETRYAEATKHESPPLIEGDLFTSLFEGATTFQPGACMLMGEMTASCTVSLTYKSAGQADTNWTDTLLMVREGRRWLIDDIVFGGTWPFAHHGKMRDILNDAITESEMPQN